ncbi:MAG: glycoside hydrolase family 5 protein, partial [Proteobacteria bacterium]|nr:glycoside hydrolase family 5 protein [Pseudomonadota bacterium]
MRFPHFITLTCTVALFSACYGYKGLPYIEDTDFSTDTTQRDSFPVDTQPPATDDTNGATPATDDAETPFSIDADGYVRSGVWHGYTDVLLNGAGTTAFPADFRGHPSQTPLCLSGVVAAVSDWNGNAQIRVRLQQDREADAPPMPVAIEPHGLSITLSNPGNTELRVIIYPESGPSYCVVMPAKQTSATFYWEQFNTHCWNDSGTFYAMQPLTALAVLVPGHNIEPRPYDFCIESFSHHNEAPISHIDTDVDTGAPVDTDRIPKAWQHGFVGDNGALQVVGNQLHNKGGGPESEPIALQGLSLFWSQWGGKYYTKEVVNELTQHWNATAIRAALGVNGPSNGYLANPTPEVARVVTVVNAAIEAGIYVI